MQVLYRHSLHMSQDQCRQFIRFRHQYLVESDLKGTVAKTDDLFPRDAVRLESDYEKTK